MIARRREFLLLTLLTLIAWAVRAALLLSTAEPTGTDGYYYVVQVERLFRDGHFHVADASWVLRFLALGAWVVGDPIIGVKLASALLVALVVPAAFLLGCAIGRVHASLMGTRDTSKSQVSSGANSSAANAAAGTAATPANLSQPASFARPTPLQAWLLAGWAAASPTLTFLCAEFPKNAGIAASGLAFSALLLQPRTSRWRWVALGLTGLLAATAHRTGAALMGLLLLGAFVGRIQSAPRTQGAAEETGRRLPFAIVLVIALSAVLFILASWFLPNLLHPADAIRLNGQLQLPPHGLSPFNYFGRAPLPLATKVELTLGWIALLIGAVSYLRTRRPAIAAATLPLFVCLALPWRSDVLDLGYRLALLSPLLAVPLFAISASTLRVARPAWAQRFATSWLAASVFPLAIVGYFGAVPSQHPPYDRFRTLIARIPRPLPALVIAQQGMSFLYDHVTGSDAMAWAPEPELDRSRIFRLVYGIRPGEWIAFGSDDPALPPPVRVDADYVYVREDVWEQFRSRALADGDDELRDRVLDWRNPPAVRPEAMLRNRPR